MAESGRRGKPDPRSGIDESGAWSPAFPGQRRPFVEGDERAGRPPEHGAYSERTVAPIAERILARLLKLAPTGDEPADVFAFEVLARQCAKLELLYGHLDEIGWVDAQGVARPAVQLLSTAENNVRKMLVELGLSTLSRERISELRASTSALISLEEATAGFAATFQVAFESLATVTRELLEATPEVAALLELRFREVFTPAVVEVVALMPGSSGDEIEGEAVEVDEDGEPEGVDEA